MDSSKENSTDSCTFEITKGLKFYKYNGTAYLPDLLLNEMINSSPKQGGSRNEPKPMTLIDASFNENFNQQKLFSNSSTTSGFFEAIAMSYSYHYHLKLSVSHFLIAINQSLSIHINENAAASKSYFVDFKEQKKKLEVYRESKDTKWSDTISEFCNLIKKNTNVDLNSIVVDDFTVRTPVSEVVSQISLMDCMKSYFEYHCYTLCGIPSITLTGTNEDWLKLKNKVDMLAELNKGNILNLDFWLKELIPVIDKIVLGVTTNNHDIGFWQNFLKVSGGGSGEKSKYSGWINVFFPYLGRHSFTINNYMNYSDNTKYKGIEKDEVHQGMCKVPFTLDSQSMAFYAGFLGFKVDDADNSVEPELFWAVVEE